MTPGRRDKSVLTVDLKSCARCGKDHGSIMFRRLRQPVTFDDGSCWSHWAICPATGEPVIMYVMDQPDHAVAGSVEWAEKDA